MPGFSVPPSAIVNQIQSNLRDRYKSGYPILKELLQNADDAKSRHFRLDACSGWPNADNPLLQGPGLLVANDGEFRQEDRDGILSYGESVKAADRATIGKFGLGQKAVFHLCDAFVIHAVGVDEPFSKVVNPFLGVDIPRNVTRDWERLSATDAAFLPYHAGHAFRERALILWLPFRRDHLYPAPGAVFSTFQPDTDEIVKDLARTDDLRVLLTALRHLESIEIRRRGEIICSVDVAEAQERLCGPQDDRPCTRSFHGTIATGPPLLSSPFIGRETTARDDRLERLRCSEHWPKTISTLRPEPTKEKGDQHGAAMLVRAPHDKDQTNELRIAWAVFLPISETEDAAAAENDADEVLPIDADVGRIHLLLHGYFFLDSGRRHIDGLRCSVVDGEIADEAQLRRAWNTRLRDEVVLPLVPTLLKEALDGNVITAPDLEHLARHIADSCWFQRNRGAICQENALVRALELSQVPRTRRISWRLVPTAAKLRPLPRTLASRPKHIDRLFEDIGQWAADHDIVLCIDQTTALTAREMQWTADELDSLFSTLSPLAFQSGPLAMLLNDLLTEMTDDDRTIIALHIVNAFRTAMQVERRLAPSDQIKNVLRHFPASRFFALPPSVTDRTILRSLSASDAALLPVRAADLRETADHSPPPETDLNKLLAALEPFIGGNDERADQAQTAALALLRGHDIRGLAKLPGFHNVRILRAHDPLTRTPSVLSIAELAYAEQYSLFQRAPGVEASLRTLVDALPHLRPLIVYTTDRGGNDGLRDLTCSVNKGVFHAIINDTTTFGPAAARARLIKRLASLTGAHDPHVIAKLCAGDSRAHTANKLWSADRLPVELDRIITELVKRRPYEFLVPSSCVSELTGHQRQEFGVTDMDTPRFERLIVEGCTEFRDLRPTKPERIAFLKTDLPDDLLRRLPIHDRSDGTAGPADGLFRVDGWPVPISLRQRVTTAILSDDPQVRRCQQRIVPRWCPIRQIDTVLSAPDANCHATELLGALSQLADKPSLKPDLKKRLREVPWITVDGTAVALNDMLNLPLPVEQEAARHFRDSASFVSVTELPRPDRDLLERAGVIPDQHSSVATLSRMIDQAGLQARLGSMADYPIEQFTELAKAGVHDLKLPGWPLLAALLSTMNGGLGQEAVACFHELSESDSTIAGEHLDALATEATKQPGPNPAEAAYRHGFAAVAKWTVVARNTVFANTLVPTKSGEWRSGKEVVAEDKDFSPAQVLADDYAKLLPIPEEHTTRADHPTPNDGDQEGRVDVLQRMSLDQHREYLADWRGRVPADLIHVYLRIAGGGNPLLERYASDWIAESTLDIESEIARLYIEKRDSPIILIDKIQGRTVEVTALSGDPFTASLREEVSSLVVEKRLQRRTPYYGHGARPTNVLVCAVRAGDLPPADVKRDTALFREFVETIASDCLPCEQMVDLGLVLDRTADVDQATLQDTERLVRDRLPGLLAALKLPERSAALEALRGYEAAEARASEGDLVRPKTKLWDSVLKASAAAEVLEAVRHRIQDHGYGDARVLFELFQNADDAYVKREKPVADPCFRVEFLAGGLRVVHWGRPINHLGTNREDGRRRGYDRDLLNMLVMNFSEKRAEDGVTGKFGLGFKCVHLLSDSVGIASGYVSLRTVGGLLPAPWHEGTRQADELRGPDLETATVIDVPYATEKAEEGHIQSEGFIAAMAWLPAFARRIKRIEVRGSKQDTVECRVSSVTADRSIDLVAIRQSARSERALRLNLGRGYSLLLKLGPGGTECFEPTVSRLWNLAPLEESVTSAWLLNGPFPVDPGRGRLAGTIEDRRERFTAVGRALGDRLVALYDVVECDRETLVQHDDLNAPTPYRFWCGLFDVMSRDLGDDLARCLHNADRGYGKLAALRPVVPTRLRWRRDTLVTASSVTLSADKALADPRILEATREWLSWSTQDLKDHVVHAEVARPLKTLGFGPIRALTLSELLQIEIGEDGCIDIPLATRLGQVITQAGVEDEPLRQERTEILETASRMRFLAQDGAWRHVSQLSSTHGGDDETLLCGFAPDGALLHQEYQGAALEFFKVARMQSGYGPNVQNSLKEWIYAAHDEQRQRAALKYLVSSRRGPDLAQSLRYDRPPTWLDDVLTEFESHPLVENVTHEDRLKLIVELDPTRLQVALPAQSYREPYGTADASRVLEQCYAWWMDEREGERSKYVESVYPDGFDRSHLAIARIDRTAWFTMLALACYQLFGRTQDGQHRSFIESGWREGWWMELAESEPPTSVRPWLDRLESWSSPERSEETYHIWERTLVDLYTISRGLNVYVELIRKFPLFVGDHGTPSTDNIFRPSDSLLAQHLSLDAAPIDRALGIAGNWLMRELSRNGVYSASEAKLVAPYCWTPWQRVRTTLQPWLDLAPDKNDSRTIFEFVIKHLDAERAHFGGDYDLPLQIVTQKRHRDLLNGWFNDAGIEPPNFDDESAGYEAEFP